MPSARDWRERVIELRDIASQTDDADERRKLLELADQWEKVAQDAEPPASPFSPVWGR